MKAPAKFESMRSTNLSEIVEDLGGVVDLVLSKWVHTQGKLVGGHTGNAFQARSQNYDTWRTWSRRNSERACLWSDTARRQRVRRFACVVDPKFIYRRRRKSFRVTNVALLRTSKSCGREPRQTCA